MAICRVGALSMPPLVARLGTGYAFCLSGLSLRGAASALASVTPMFAYVRLRQAPVAAISLAPEA